MLENSRKEKRLMNGKCKAEFVKGSSCPIHLTITAYYTNAHA